MTLHELTNASIRCAPVTFCGRIQLRSLEAFPQKSNKSHLRETVRVLRGAHRTEMASLSGADRGRQGAACGRIVVGIRGGGPSHRPTTERWTRVRTLRLELSEDFREKERLFTGLL